MEVPRLPVGKWGGGLWREKQPGHCKGSGFSGGRSLSPDSPQTTAPTFGSGARCSGTSRMALCPCHSGSSTRRSGAGSG